MMAMKKAKKYDSFVVGAFLCVLLILGLCGCSTVQVQAPIETAKQFDTVNNQIDVMELKIGMTDQELVKALGDAEKDNCVYGYEMNYEDKKLSIGVNTEGKVRRIKTSNPKTSICAVTIYQS